MLKNIFKSIQCLSLSKLIKINPRNKKFTKTVVQIRLTKQGGVLQQKVAGLGDRLDEVLGQPFALQLDCELPLVTKSGEQGRRRQGPRGGCRSRHRHVSATVAAVPAAAAHHRPQGDGLRGRELLFLFLVQRDGAGADDGS